MEFEITTDLSLLKNQQIDANFTAVSAWLDEELAPYKGMLVTSDMIPAAKSYRANLRKVKDRIEQYRKEAKNAALAPYNLFEQKCKELTVKIDEAANNLDVQVKEFERQEADAKVAELRHVYESYQNDEVRYYLPWDVLYNPKWANKTYALEQAKDEINHALERTERDLAAIRSMTSDNAAYLLDVYAQTRDISAVIRKNTEINARKVIEEHRRKETEERRKAEEEAARQRHAARLEAKEQPQQETVSPAVTTDVKKDEMVVVDFRVQCTKKQLYALSQFMRSNGIKYGKVGE